MRNIIHPVSVGPDIIRGKMTVDAGEYFNKPDKMKDMKQFADVIPVDIYGALVPEGKELSNLPKMEAQIQKRFGLEEVKKGGE
jgi:hypothetical protein